MEKIISASCPFPLKKLNVSMKYAAVQKPSGVGYIILVLIKEAKNRDGYFRDVLKTFGVPDNLQFIFAGEIEVLLSREILRMRQGILYQHEYFDDFKIGNFEFTQNGERMFREGAIPTGEEKSRNVTVFFNPLTSEFSFDAPNHQPIEKADCYPEGFMDNVEADLSGLKDFLIDNIRRTGLQKEESLLDCSISSCEHVTVSVEGNLELHIDRDGMEISLKTSGAEAFYEKYFTPDMTMRVLEAKSKFRFPDAETVKAANGFNEYKNLSAIYLPEDYAKQISRRVKLLLTCDNGKVTVKYSEKTAVLENENITAYINAALNSNWSFIAIDAKEIRACTAARVKITGRVLKHTIEINLLVEQIFSSEQKLKVLNAVFENCLPGGFSKEKCELIRIICELSQKTDFIARYISAKLNGSDDPLIQKDILFAANEIFSGAEWKITAKKHADEIYKTVISGLNSDNLENVKIAASLNEIRQPEEKDSLLNDVLEKLKKHTANEIKLFNLLTEAGFSENESLSAVNIVKAYVDKILAGEANFEQSCISDNFSVLAGNLNNLKKNLGINSAVNYAFRENYNKEKFINNFRNFKKMLSLVRKYSGFAQEGFNEIFKYEKIMQPAYEYIMIEYNASQSPDKISEKYIREKIETGDYRMAVGDMIIRLDFMLSKFLKIENSGSVNVNDKIDRAKTEKIISPEQADKLHELRMFRNQLFHPAEERFNFDKQKIAMWADTVFSVREPVRKMENTKKSDNSKGKEKVKK